MTMIKASKIMTTNVITVSEESDIIRAADLIITKAVSSLVVLEKERPVGVVSETDIIHGIVGKKKKIKDLMDKEFLVIPPDTSFNEVARQLREKKIKRFLVVENERLIGLITETDIIETTRDFTRFHHMVQDVILAIFGFATFFFLFYFSSLRAAIFG